MSISFLQVLQGMGKSGASDLHLKTNAPPVYRVFGSLRRISDQPLSADDMKAIVEKIVPKRLQPELPVQGAVDFAFSIDPVTRFRCNAYYQRGTMSIALRLLQNDYKSFEDLHMPASIERIPKLRRGLVLVTGPTGSGKSTTMAALVDGINSSRTDHIITIEDPIEFLHQDKMALIQQREIGSDAKNFEQALKHALREDPDVILVGEMRDAETIVTAMRAAMTGHLVISTLHTINCVQTIRRILRYFQPDEQESMRGELAMALKAVLSQRLIPMKDGSGRVPQVELMFINDMVSKLIRENRIDDISQVLRNGQDGMQHFDVSLAELSRKQLISVETGEEFAEDIAAFRRMHKGGQSGGDRSGLIGA